MKRLVLITILLLCGALNVEAAGRTEVYRDLIRPNGHPRSDAIHDADLNLCYARTGADRNRPDTASFKSCMRTRGYRYVGSQVRHAPRERMWVDPDTGLTCKDMRGSDGTVYGSHCSNNF
jgi:hypothetical protein